MMTSRESESEFEQIETENILYSFLGSLSPIIIIIIQLQYYDCLADKPRNVSNTQYYILALAVVAD